MDHETIFSAVTKHALHDIAVVFFSTEQALYGAPLGWYLTMVDAELFSFFISMAAREAGPALKYV